MEIVLQILTRGTDKAVTDKISDEITKVDINQRGDQWILTKPNRSDVKFWLIMITLPL